MSGRTIPPEHRDLPHFSDPTTSYHIPSVSTSAGVVHNGEPSGFVICLQCGEGHLDIDEIDHPKWCPQYWAHSEWWWQQHPDAIDEFRRSR